MLPLVTRLAKALSGWLLQPAYDQALELRPDLDQLPPLAPEREALWASLEKTSFLTPNEKRAAAGYGPVSDGDGIKFLRSEAADKANFNPAQLRVPRGQPGGGQWIDEGGGDGSDLVKPAQARRGGGGRQPPAAPPKPGPNPPIPPGTTIRNKDLAGKKHPDTGIPFDKDGFPDFSGVTTNTVRLPHTGDRSTDFRAANRAAGYGDVPEPPKGMTWHHHQDGHTMQLVLFDLHRRTGHTGSIGIGNTPGKR